MNTVFSYVTPCSLVEVSTDVTNILPLSSRSKGKPRNILARYRRDAEPMRRYMSWHAKTKKLNSVACSPQANYTDRAAAAC
jgi:hypothetical protein